MNTRVSLKSLSKREAVVKSASFPRLLFIITLLTTGTGHYGNAARGERVTYVETVFFMNLIKFPSLELNLRRGLPASLVPLVLRGQYVWTVPHQALLPTEFSRQAYWHGVPSPCPEFKPMSLNVSCTGRWITYYQHQLGSPRGQQRILVSHQRVFSWSSPDSLLTLRRPQEGREGGRRRVNGLLFRKGRRRGREHRVIRCVLV